jgi:cation:H+ antiporter
LSFETAFEVIMSFYIISGLIGLAVVAVSCRLFTNSIEWAGIRLKVNHGVTGKILAAAGAAIPQTIIPIIAVIFIPGERGQEVSTGAILGAPLMLSTLAFGITGAAALIYRVMDKRPVDFKTGEKSLSDGLIFFIAIYAAAVIFSFFPITVKKSLGFLFLLAYVVHVYRAFKKGWLAEEEAPRSLYFSKKKNPEGKLVLLQSAVSVFGMAAGAKFFVSGVEQAALVMNIKAFILTLLIAPLATEIPEILNSLIWVKKKKETLALANISRSMVFRSSLVVFVGIIATDWILSPQAKFSAIVAIASAVVAVAVLKVNKRISAYMLLPGFIFYALYLTAVIKWVR